MKKTYKITTLALSLAALMPITASAYSYNASASVSASTTDSYSTSTYSTSTENSKIGDKIEALREKALQKKEELENKISSSTEARKDKINSVLKERFVSFVNIIIKRFSAAAERFVNIAARIDSRIGKLDAAGADTSNMKALLADAKVKIDLAKSDIALIQVDASASTTQIMYNQVKTESDKAKEDLKTAQDALSKTVQALMKIKVEIHATSTASTTESH